MSRPRHVVFLPGAAGASEFWRPVSARLPSSWRRTLLDWPGAGSEPPDPAIASFETSTEHVEARLPEACDLMAQSMGGIVALALALQNPGRIRRRVLVATSGGLDVAGLGAGSGEINTARNPRIPLRGSPSSTLTTQPGLQLSLRRRC